MNGQTTSEANLFNYGSIQNNNNRHPYMLREAFCKSPIVEKSPKNSGRMAPLIGDDDRNNNSLMQMMAPSDSEV